MVVNAIGTGDVARVLPATVPALAISAGEASENREVVRAVRALNQSEMFNDDHELTFQRDLPTNRMVVRVVNRKTREVVSQIPSELVLRLAEGLPKAAK